VNRIEQFTITRAPLVNIAKSAGGKRFPHSLRRISQSTPGSKRRITLRTFQGAIKTLISDSRCENATYEMKYEVVKHFWYAVSKTFLDAWADHPKHLLVKGVGIAALAELGRDVIQECLAHNDTSIEALSQFLGKLEGLDWGNKTSPFSFVGGQKGATAAAKALKGVVFGELDITGISETLIPQAAE
jgi:hypothetical protein